MKSSYEQPLNGWKIFAYNQPLNRRKIFIFICIAILIDNEPTRRAIATTVPTERLKKSRHVFWLHIGRWPLYIDIPDIGLVVLLCHSW